MKLMELKRGMVIRCVGEENLKLFLKLLEKMKYEWDDGRRIRENDISWVLGEYDLFLVKRSMALYPAEPVEAKGLRKTDFPEILESGMTSAEILDWIKTHNGDNAMMEVFGCSNIDSVFEKFTGEEIEEHILSYETEMIKNYR